MPSKTQTGNYYVNRTVKWLESEGWTVAKAERAIRITRKNKDTGELETFYRKFDIWGADLFAINGIDFLAIQVKTNAGDVAKGIKELLAHPWPLSCGLWVVRWEKRAREPEITEVERDSVEIAPNAVGR